MQVFVNKVYEFKVTQFDRQRKYVSISRKQLLIDEENKKFDTFFSTRKIGDILNGKIEKFFDFGIIVNVNGISGLVHITNISWGYTKEIPSKYVLGMEIQVKILEMNKEKRKIGFGIKQLTDDPWSLVEKKYSIGKIVSGKIIKVDNNGFSIQIEEGVIAFLPMREVAWKQNQRETYNSGDIISVKIIELNIERKSMILSLRQKMLNPWNVVKEKKEMGAAIEAVVSDIKPNYLILQIFNGLEGIVPRKFAGWDENQNLERQYKIGQSVVCKIIELNDSANKMVLSIKDTMRDPWYEKIEKLNKIKVFKCKVLKILRSGVIVELIDQNLTGYIHISQLSEKNIKNPEEVVKADDVIFAELLQIDEKDKRISLSVIEYEKEKEKEEIKSYLSSQEEIDSSLGNIFGFDKILEKN